MISLYDFLTKYTPLEIFPYTLLSLFVIVYFAYQKYLTRREIRNVPSSTVFGEDLDKIKKNLEVKSLVYTFILILSMSELILNILLEGTLMSVYDFGDVVTNSVNISEFCVVRDPTLLRLMDNSTLLASFIYHIGLVVIISFAPLISLFFTILRRIYLNHPYQSNIRNFTLYLALRFLLMAVLYCNLHTFYLAQILLLPFGLIDFSIYIRSVRVFYQLLKGLRDEARWHSTQYDYNQKKRTVTHFFYTQILIFFVCLLLLTVTLLLFIGVPIGIFAFNPCFLSYITFDFIPNFTIPTQVQLFAHKLSNYCFVLQSTIGTIVEVIMILTQLSILIAILIKLFRRRRDFNRINDQITRPLMEQYRDTLAPNARNYQQRRLFVLYARSMDFNFHGRKS